MAQSENSALAQQKGGLFTVGDSGSGKGYGSLSNYKMPTGIISVDSIIPGEVKAIIESQFTALGLNFSIDDLAVKAGKDSRATLKTFRDTVTQMQNEAKLLPMWVETIKKALNVGVKNAQAKAKIAKHALKTQHKIDEAQADIIMALMGYRAETNKLMMKLERRAKKLEAVENARAMHYQKTWGAEKAFLDASWANSEEIALKRYEAKTQIAEGNKNRKLESEQYVAEALK